MRLPMIAPPTIAVSGVTGVCSPTATKQTTEQERIVRMHPVNLQPLALVALAATLSGCITTHSTIPDEHFFASDAVIQEMRNTRPAFTRLPVKEQALVHLWLLANCAVGAEDHRTQFAHLDARAEAALIEAFRMGPPSALLTELGDTRRRDYAAIKVRLEGEDRELFSPSLRAQLATLAEHSYLKEGIDLTITSYRIAALRGLALIGTQTSIAWLDQTVSTLKDPEVSRAAQGTLEALRDRQHR